LRIEPSRYISLAALYNKGAMDTAYYPFLIVIVSLVAIAGFSMIVIGALYMMTHLRGHQDRGRADVRGESIGVILLGPFPIVLRGRGNRLLQLIIPVVIALTVFVIATAVIITAIL